MRTKEVVINKCWGGFGLTHKAVMLYAKLSGFKLYPFVEEGEKRGKEWSPVTGKYKPYVNEKSKGNPYSLILYSKKPLRKDGTYEEKSWFDDSGIERDDPILVKVVKKLGEKSFGEHANLRVVKIPVNIKWEIDDYDGQECVREQHKSWG